MKFLWSKVVCRNINKKEQIALLFFICRWSGLPCYYTNTVLNPPAPRVKRHRLHSQRKPTFPLAPATPLHRFRFGRASARLGRTDLSRFSPATINKKEQIALLFFICRWSGSNRHVVAYTRF